MQKTIFKRIYSIIKRFDLFDNLKSYAPIIHIQKHFKFDSIDMCFKSGEIIFEKKQIDFSRFINTLLPINMTYCQNKHLVIKWFAINT